MLRSKMLKYTIYLPYLIIFIITALYITLALLRHFNFQTYGYDLGNHDQTVWMYSRFIYPFVTIEYKFALLNHFGPSLILFAPLYWGWSDVRMLLIAQPVLIGLSAIPFIWIMRKNNFPLLATSIVTLSYLIFYGYQFSINFDVHTLVFGTSLIPWFVWSIEEKRYKLASIFLLIILGMKENFGVITGSIGLVYLLRKKYKVGFSIIFASAFYLLLVFKVFIPVMQYYTQEFYRFSPSDPSSPFDIILRLFNTQDKIEVWKLSFLWFALIPLFSPITLIPVLADIAFYFVLGNKHTETQSIFMHYRSSLTPLLTWATIYGLINIKNKLKIPFFLSSILLLFTTLYFQYAYHLPLNSLTKSYWWEFPQWTKNNHQILKLVPKDVPLAAQDNLIPHLSHRRDIHIIWPSYNKPFEKAQSPCGEEHCMWLRFHRRAKYLVTDVHPGQNPVMLLMDNEIYLQNGLKNMEKLGVISLEQRIGDAAIWKVNPEKHKQYGD